jgi:hypothetical protein
MPGGIVLSATMHLLIIALVIVGLPMLIHPPPPEDLPIAVELVTLGPETRATHPNPKPRAKAKPDAAVADAPVPKPDLKPEPPPPTPEPPPSSAAPPPEPMPPAPTTQPAKPPQPAPPPPKPPEPQAVAPPPPKPPEPKPKPPKPAPAAEAKPEIKKTETAAAFESLLKNLTRQQSDPTEPTLPQPKRLRTASAEPSSQPRAPLGSQLTVSELDLIRQQIAQCWNIPAGARDAQDLVIEIKVAVNSDGTVRQARIVDTGRYAGDTFFRAAADSAVRAVLNPRCSPLRLPPDKYEAWQNLDLFFNPKDVL